MSMGWVAWADLVFHVLAHVRGSAGLAASVYDPRYVAFAERRLGAARERALAEDAEHLASVAPTHDALGSLQLLAWLFRDLERAGAAGSRALSELSAADVDDPSVLPHLGTAAEILWCAALLELEAFRKLPSVEIDEPVLEAELARAVDVAPRLASCRVEVARALCRRGRVRGDAIWVGLPSEELGVSVAHVVWQASHEATVQELSLLARSFAADVRPTEREIEHAAVVKLFERAGRAGRGDAHAGWLAHFGSRAPATDRSTLSASALRLIG